MRSAISLSAVAAVLFAVGVASPAWAQAPEEKVELKADLVLVSNQGSAVDAGLEGMKDAFAQKHFNFTSFKRLSSETLRLDARKAKEIRLPNGKSASLLLLKLQNGEATVEVTVGKVVKTQYTLGREGSVFVNTGKLQDGEVFLVLAPSGGK
jgi:hypothetical protein